MPCNVYIKNTFEILPFQFEAFSLSNCARKKMQVLKFGMWANDKNGNENNLHLHWQTA